MNNILIINQPLNNRGDESAHRALIRSLKTNYPTAEIKVVFLFNRLSDIQEFKVFDDVEYLNLCNEHAYITEKILKYAVLSQSYFLYTILHSSLRKLLQLYRNADVISEELLSGVINQFKKIKPMVVERLPIPEVKTAQQIQQTIQPQIKMEVTPEKKGILETAGGLFKGKKKWVINLVMNLQKRVFRFL